jgi:Thioesterase superfamily
LPAVPPGRLAWTSPSSLLAFPEGATALEPGFAPDSAPTVFGLCHTDANQHVAALVYMRLFEEAALRRFASLGEKTVLLARFLDVGLRKPCFAGERVRIVLRAFRLGKQLGVVAAVVSEQEAGTPIENARPYCCIRMLFER